ncbi:class II fructose-bisphosphate aldolase [bacterium]|nr:class II fructose-bisphosphate aldolase [bacterium]
MATNQQKLLEIRPENITRILGSESKVCAVNSRNVFDSFLHDKFIIMACNTRIKHVIPGIMRAAEELDAVVGFELAKSEGYIDGGYTGQTPKIFVETILEYAEKIGFTKPFIIHGDHITVKDTSDKELSEAQALIAEELKQGYTSFAIDASHNPIPENLEITMKLVPPILEAGLGLEVEVGEIAGLQGKLTTVEEARHYISTLKENDVDMNLLAINNGSKHGNYDPDEEVHIDLNRTGKIFEAIRHFGVSIAQHGITGTPLHLVGQFADYGIRKGNVGTNWQNLAHDGLPPELFQKIKDWVKETGKPIKKSTKVFKSEIDNIPEINKKEIADAAYISAMEFIRGFRAENTATLLAERLFT